MTKTFDTTPVLDRVGEVLSFAVMVGLTVVSAATYASRPAPALPQLPTVVVTAKAPAALPQLPTVVVQAKRASTSS